METLTQSKTLWILARPLDNGQVIYSLEGNDYMVEAFKKDGYMVVEQREIFFTPPSYEELIPAVVEALRAKQVNIRAEAEAQCNSVDGQINRLLRLEYVEAATPRGEFAPRSAGLDSSIDDIPF